jgi:intracellular multiplication protein IcmE
VVDGPDGASTPAKATQGAPVHKQFPAGTVWLATTTKAIDSYVPGPVTAIIEQGPFAGGEALGSYEIRGRSYITMTFTRVVYKGVEYPVDAVGLNPDTGIAGLKGDVNNHWGSRLILPTLAAAIGRYAEAATFGGITTISPAGSVIQEPELSSSEQIKYALGTGVSEGITPVIREEAGQIERQVTQPQKVRFGFMLVEGI